MSQHDNSPFAMETHRHDHDREVLESPFNTFEHGDPHQSTADRWTSRESDGVMFEDHWHEDEATSDYVTWQDEAEDLWSHEGTVVFDGEASGEFDDETVDVEEEVVMGTNKTHSLSMRAAPPPCIPPTAAPPADSGGGGARVPNYRPGAGRRTRRSSRDYVRWVQSILKNVLGARLKVDGLFGRNTSRALRDFQRLAKIGVDGKLGPQTEGALRKFSNTNPPEREVAFEALAPAAVVAAAPGVAKGVVAAVNFIKFGFDTIGKITKGNLKYKGPSAPIGIRAQNVPAEFNLRVQKRDTLIINFMEESKIGVEQLRIKLRCSVMYDGLNLEARFSFDPGGDRSRLLRDTDISINPAFTMEEGDSPRDWVSCGVPKYRILRIPIVFKIDRPWPLDNYNETVDLVLSTMYGFGATASGRGRRHIQNQKVAWN